MKSLFMFGKFDLAQLADGYVFFRVWLGLEKRGGH
jgi:hypothetical protein